MTNLIRWPLFGFLIAAADPELSEATERLKASSKKGAPQDPETVARAEADEAAVTELLTGWRRHEGVVKVASRVPPRPEAVAALRAVYADWRRIYPALKGIGATDPPAAA